MEVVLSEITLRPPKDCDAVGFIEICAEVETMQYYGIPGACIRTPEEAADQISWCRELFNENGGRWIITETGSDRYIGDIGFHSIEMEHKRAEIGYRLKRAYWGQGIGSRVIAALLDYGFNQLGYNRIEALVDSRNSASMQVLVKNGFTREGVLREYEWEYGKPVDLVMYSLLCREFVSK